MESRFAISPTSTDPFPAPEQEPAASAPQPDMVYVAERLRWEYRVLIRASEQPPSERDLNEWGEQGWELSGIAPVGNAMHFYFKRACG